jgi:hypothetical protein
MRLLARDMLHPRRSLVATPQLSTTRTSLFKMTLNRSTVQLRWHLQEGTHMAKKTTRKRTTTRSRSAGKRDLVRRRKTSAYAKRTESGRFTSMDDVGRSQVSDKSRRAKKRVRSGFGDQGDTRRRTRKRT